MSAAINFKSAKPNFLSLPVELLYTLHLWALNPALPLASKRLYNIFKAAPPSISALYLFYRYANTSKDLAGIVTSVLRYPICSLEVFKRFQTIIPEEYCYLYPNSRQNDNAPPVLETPMRLFKLPKRLFRGLKPPETGDGHNEAIYTFLKHLYNLPPISYLNTDKTQSMRPNSNSHDGYPLAKAVLVRDIRLIKLLLAHKADPSRNENIAVILAIKNRDLELVKLLVEGEKRRRTKVKGRETQRHKDTRDKRRTFSSIEEEGDLVVVNNLMLRVAVAEKARDIIEWLVKEKGCIPDIKTLRSME